MENKRVKLVVLIIALTSLLLGLVGVTFAYFTSESVLSNEFNAAKYKTTAREEFVSPSNWAPGDTTPKTLVVKNEGDIDMNVRVSISESWKNKDDEDMPLEQDGNRVSIINFDNQNDWTKIGNYYYYNDVLAPNEETSSLISSVTFNPLVTGDYTCSTVGSKTTCTSTGDSYEGGSYTLTFTIETVQAEARGPVWNMYSFAFANRQNENSITTGDEICLGTECFYVISSDQATTVLFAKYNLLVGDVFDYDYNTGNYTLNKTLSNSDAGYGLQNSNAIGDYLEEGVTEYQYIGMVPFSGTNYWDNSVCGYTNTNWSCTGTDGLLPEYSQNGETYWSSPHNTDYPYVYRSNIGNNTAPSIVYDYDSEIRLTQNNGYTISYYVENYVNALKTLGAPSTIISRLLRQEEAVSLGCSETDGWCSSTDNSHNPTNGTAPSWVYNTTYWLGSANSIGGIWFVYSGGYFNSNGFDDGCISGVRPVIEIPTNVIIPEDYDT